MNHAMLCRVSTTEAMTHRGAPTTTQRENRLSEDGRERGRGTPELWWELESNMGMCVSDVVIPLFGVLKHLPQITQSGARRSHRCPVEVTEGEEKP